MSSCHKLLPAAWSLVLLLSSIFGLPEPAPAASSLPLDSPRAFFTNVAARLLGSELQLDLHRLQVYPTNDYTPSAHRLLQLTANLYDSTTNRTLGLAPEYPYCPSVFRPLFRRISLGTNTCVVIASYREVTNADMADSRLAPAMVDLNQPNPPLLMIPPYGMAFSSDRNEPMISGIPLVIGAKKGFPNFNEFSMQTEAIMARYLEFRRAVENGPVVETNQMYVIGVSNTFGLEAWNSYLTNYPRELKLTASVYLTAILTNETGQSNVLFSNTVAQGISFLIPSNNWSGWTAPAAASSMILPFGTTNGFFFLTNSSYINAAPWFLPETHTFTTGTDFYVPHWWLNLKTRLLFILEDTAANRIVDYVTLNRSEPTLDLTTKLTEGSLATNPLDYQNPADQWLTNRAGNSASTSAPTYGILNQIQAGLLGVTAFQGFVQDPFAGLDLQSAVDNFRYNLISAGPLYPKDLGRIFYKSNIFYAPLVPYRPIYIHVSWQANDPLVHYLSTDLLDLRPDPTNQVNFVSQFPPLSNLGRINNRYCPWGGNPLMANPAVDYQLALKDPGVQRSDDWDFPSNQALDVDWVGKVHRGTPWQTIFIKSTNILDCTSNLGQNLVTWIGWTGNSLTWLDAQGPLPFRFDALLTAPTNDWHIVGVLNELFNTNAPSTLASPNQTSLAQWESLLDGIAVLTNSAPDQFSALTMSGNSPQASLIAAALLQNRSAQPGGLYHSVADLLSTPELTVASPWLGPANTLTDEALEIIPGQLLARLRSDSMGSTAAGNGSTVIQFTGIDGYPYTVQASSDLAHWVPFSTNVPSAGRFYFSVPPSNSAQFFRSRLLR